jgi:steroid delta-isomerase-like uncharacterized protein
VNHREHLEELWRVLDAGRVELIDRYFAEEYRRHSEEGTLTRDEFATSLAALHDAFPDIETTIHDVVVQESRAASRWSARGTHQGIYMGVPPTGKEMTAMGITISSFGPDGRLVEDWASWNHVSVLHALGIIPIGR